MADHSLILMLKSGTVTLLGDDLIIRLARIVIAGIRGISRAHNYRRYLNLWWIPAFP